jgi:signal transduction histidine kinase
VHEAFAAELRNVMDVDWATIALIEGERLRFFALSSGIGSAWAPGEVIPLKGTATEWVATYKRALVEPDLVVERKFWTGDYHLRQEVRSIVYLPLLLRGEAFGALLIASRRPNAYGAKELEILGQLVAHISGAIETARLYALEKARRMELEREESERMEFIAAITHELKTPLTAIIASGELLSEELGEEGEGSPLNRLVRNITTSAWNMEARLSDLLDMAKIRTGGFQLRLEPLSIAAVLEEVVAQFQPIAQGKGQSLSLELPPSLPLAKADRRRMEQVMFNLLSNATKFTSPGGRVTIRARESGDMIVIEVEDTGSGISEEEQARIFQPYYRVEADRQRFPRLGLGLALSKQLVEFQGGQMWVHSTPGQGSIFSFSLPLDKGTSKA